MGYDPGLLDNNGEVEIQYENPHMHNEPIINEGDIIKINNEIALPIEWRIKRIDEKTYFQIKGKNGDWINIMEVKHNDK